MPRLPIFASLAALPAGILAAEPIELGFVDHVTAGMIEQDVYIDKMGDDQVYRVTAEEAAEFIDAPVYTSAEVIHHAPMDASKVGPYPKGESLDLTLGEWLSASGTATYDCVNGTGTLSAQFENLVPSGVYTMWQFFAANPMMEEFRTYEMPVGARDGADATFTADAEGNGTYEVEFEPCLQGSGPQLDAGLAIAYHSDEATYGDVPGPIGTVAHIHLFTGLPPQGDMPG